MKTVNSFLLAAMFPLFALVAGDAFADQSVVSVDPAQDQIELSADTYLLEDPTHTLTLDEILKPENQTRFSAGSPRIGLTVSSYWLRYHIKNTDENPVTKWFDTGNRRMRVLEFFSPDASGKYASQTASADRPFADRPLPTPNFVFPVTVAPRVESVLYLRVRTLDALSIDLAPNLWNPQAYRDSAEREKVQWFAYLGIAAILVVINLALFAFTRDRDNWLYVLAVIGTVLTASCARGGYGAIFEYLWPNYPSIQIAMEPISTSLAALFGITFINHFAQLDKSQPKSTRLSFWLVVAGAMGYQFVGIAQATAGLVSIGMLQSLLTMSSFPILLSLLIMIYGVFMGAVSRNRSALFVAVGFGPVIVNSVAALFVITTGHSVGPERGVWFSAFEMVVMAVAIADRLHQERNAKFRVQTELVESLQQQVRQTDQLGRLKRFFSPQLAEVIVAGGEEALKTHRREVSVVFIDLRGFTAFTDKAEPEEVMEMLRAFHATMGRIVMDHNGTLERFAGDSVMVFFNDPVPMENHAERAVLMALKMQEAFVTLGENWSQRGFNLGLGCGIALGYATLGEIGFEGRWDYAAIGSVTNLAARLCAEAASGEVLVDQKMMDKVGAMVSAQEKGSLSLKGFAQPVSAFSLISLKS